MTVVGTSLRRIAARACAGSFVVTAIAVSASSAGCKRAAPNDPNEVSAGSMLPPSPRASSPEMAPRRPGMVWIPAGTLRAGTPSDRIPRVPDEELPGTAVEMGGFYIDQLPWPNETGAIPTTNVTRDDAAALCAGQGKRLCTELEWERACKGEGNTAYEYGDAYRASACGTGVASEDAARRPTGEHAQCKSSFGVSDMHGTVWEWTDSPWARGHAGSSLGVLRGGNAMAGELVGRCANSIGRAPTKKSPTMGLRCCAGPKNEAIVDLALEGKPVVELLPASKANAMHDAWEPALRPAFGVATNRIVRVWRWVPVPNEELFVFVGCAKAPTEACSIAIGREASDSPYVLASAEIGRMAPDLLRLGDMRHLRVRALDVRGTFGRDLTYVYGNVDLGDPRRP